MKKSKLKAIISSIIAVTFAAIFCISCAEPTLQEGEIAGFALPHANVMAHTGSREYDSNLFYVNDGSLAGADPGAIFVSEDEARDSYAKIRKSKQYESGGEWKWLDGWSEDRFIAEYGSENDYALGYGDQFYCVTTGFGYASEIDKQAGWTIGAFPIAKSKDLNNWKSCGTLCGGMALGFKANQWVNGVDCWAPEIVRDDESGLYFLFFSGSAVARRDGDVFATGLTAGRWDSLYISCAIATNPTGPYEIASAEDYLYAISRKNADGSVIKGADKKPSADLNRDGEPDEDLYEIYASSDGRVVGFVNEEGNYYTLNGYEITERTPVLNVGYYYPRTCENKGKVEEFESLFHVPDTEKDGSPKDNCIWPGIDVNPVTDYSGNKYLYFCQHASTFITDNEIWAVAMKDWLTPDWNTMQRIASPNYEKVVQDGTLSGRAEGDVPGERLNEGAHVIEHNGKWFFTYSPYGYSSKAYSVHIAVADGPFGPFVKLKGAYSPVIGLGEESLDGIGGTGHHGFVKAGNELWALYHCFASGVSVAQGRSISADRIVWRYVPELGYEMMFGNGPTDNLQPKPEVFTGYENVAKYAEITGNGDKGEVEYLTDGMITAQPFARKYEYGKSDGGLIIHLKWAKPVKVKALMIYNSGSAYEAFKTVDSVTFKLYEKPSWYGLADYNGYCYVENLGVDPYDYFEKNELMRKGSSAVAEFNEITVTEMHVSVSGSERNRFCSTDANGNETSAVALSEIYLFGKEA